MIGVKKQQICTVIVYSSWIACKWVYSNWAKVMGIKRYYRDRDRDHANSSYRYHYWSAH